MCPGHGAGLLTCRLTSVGERCAHIPTMGMVLAAGLGLRMRPLTERIPKPMVTVNGRTLIDRALDLMQSAGVQRVVVNTAYLAEVLESHLAARIGPDIVLSREEKPLETGGGIRRALPHFDGKMFVAVNSDALVIDGAIPAIHRLATQWDERRMDALLLLLPVEKALGYEGPGDFFLEENGMLRRRGQATHAPYVFTGMQLLHPRLFEAAPDGAFSMNLLYDRRIDAQGRLPNIFGLVHDGAWLHVGDMPGLMAAEQFLRKPDTN